MSGSSQRTVAPRIRAALDRPAWYLHRLRSMPVQELPHRVAEQGRRFTGRLPHAPADRPVGTRQDTGLADTVLRWRDDPGVREFWRERGVDAADGGAPVFDLRSAVSAGGTPAWDLDPRTGDRWPSRYCFDVPPSPGGGAEVKYVWELNRLVHLLPVAAAGAADDDDRCRALCHAQLRSWIRENPPRTGVVWRSGIELAIRVLSLVVVLELTAGREDDAALEQLVGRSVADHVGWIRRFPSRHSSANNHRVAELAGLLVAAAAYPDLVPAGEAAAWWREFEDVVGRQFHPDGVPAEQATGYGLLVLEWVAICLRAGAPGGSSLAAGVRERVQAGARFLATVVDRGGNVVRIGDDDDTRLLTAARPHADHPRAVLDLLARSLPGPPAAPARGLSTFADGGYTVWRSAPGPDEVLWVLDHGPLGMGDLAAHAHADTLSVHLHHAGRPVLVDAGTYLYAGPGSWRSDLRSTRVHNTLTVAGADSSEMAGPFNWRRSRRARGRLLTARSSSCGWKVEAEHDGYLRDHGVLHHRTLAGDAAGRFRLTDRLEGARRLPVTWSLLAAPHLDVTETPEGWLLCDTGTPVLRIDVPDGWRRSVRYGSPEGGEGWCSPAFGRLLPAAQMLLSGWLGGSDVLDVGITLVAPARRPPDRTEVDQ